MTTKELLANLNALRIANGKTELANWKSSREKLEAAIVAETPADKPLEGEILPPVSNDETIQPVDETDKPSDLSDVEGQTDQPTEPVVEAPLIPRGAIGALSIEYLTGSDEPYADIVAKIVAQYPTAKTTARSLASVAMDLRRDGIEVPSRRKPAAVKPAKTVEAPAGE